MREALLGGEPATLASLGPPRRVGAHLAAHDLPLRQPSFPPRHPAPASPLRGPCRPGRHSSLGPSSQVETSAGKGRPPGLVGGRVISKGVRLPARHGGHGKEFSAPARQDLRAYRGLSGGRSHSQGALAGPVSHVSVSGHVLGQLLSWGGQWSAQASTGHQPRPQGEPQSRLLADLTALPGSPDRRGTLRVLSLCDS